MLFRSRRPEARSSLTCATLFLRFDSAQDLLLPSSSTLSMFLISDITGIGASKTFTASQIPSLAGKVYLVTGGHGGIVRPFPPLPALLTPPSGPYHDARPSFRRRNRLHRFAHALQSPRRHRLPHHCVPVPRGQATVPPAGSGEPEGHEERCGGVLGEGDEVGWIGRECGGDGVAL